MSRDVQLMPGLHSNVRIRSSGDALEITTKGAVVVSIKETYKYNGEVSQCSRRDKRWGKHKGKIVSASDSKVVLDIKWDDPHGGVLKETFEVSCKPGEEHWPHFTDDYSLPLSLPASHVRS